MRMLGKLPPRHDPRTLRLAKYLDLTKLPPIPSACDWTVKASPAWGMMGNDRVADCAVAAIGHGVQTWSANAAREITIPDQAIIKAYSAISGYRPSDPSSDRGSNMLDVLCYARKTGVGGHKIGAFAAVDPRDAAHVRAAVYLFGGLYTGLALPLSAERQKVWAVPAGGVKGKGAPGSWGGHAVWVVKFNGAQAVCITWAALQAMVWLFWGTYCDECYAVLSPDWLSGRQVAPSGFNLAALQADLKAVAS